MRKDRDNNLVTVALVLCVGLIALLVVAIVVMFLVTVVTSAAATRRPERGGAAQVAPRRPVEGHFALHNVVDSRPT